MNVTISLYTVKGFLMVDDSHKTSLVPIGEPFKTKIYDNFRRSDMFVVCECRRCDTIVCKRVKDLKTNKSCGCGIWKKRVQKFTEEDIQKMLKMAENGESASEIGRVMGCNHKTVIKYLNKLFGTQFERSGGKRNRSWEGVGDLYKSYVTRLKRAAQERGRDLDLTLEFLWELFQKQNGKCAISNIDIHLGPPKEQTASLDRIRSDIGYEEDNVQWVHKTVNIMKWNIPEKVFIGICATITDHQRQIHERDSV